MLRGKACGKRRFAEDMEGEGEEDLGLIYFAHVLIWDLILQCWDKSVTDLCF